jgi:hypothetical protein
MKPIWMSHYAVMMKTVSTMRCGHAKSPVMPKYIFIMADGTAHMSNAFMEVFYTRLPNGDVEPVNLDPRFTPVQTIVLEDRKQALKTLREWYAQA